jgi:hypothetical protein
VFVEVRRRSRGQVSGAMTVWAILMAVVIFCLEARVGRADVTGWIGVGVSVLFGALLGWRRRVAAVLVAPFVSWLWAWFPLWIAAMIHDGFFGGLAIGFFLVTVGWIGIGLLEAAVVGIVALVVRSLHGRNDGDVVVFGPGSRP